MRFIIIFVILLVYYSANAATVYYVDFSAGSDANDGTSQVTPWKTIPGTRTTDGSAYLNLSWGLITTATRIPDNTTINIKSGTTHSSANGGYIFITAAAGGFYDTGLTNIVIQKDITWSSGTTTINGTSMTIDVGLFRIQIDGLTIRGLDIRNSDVSGLQFKEKPGSGSALTNIIIDSCTFYNNGKSYLSDVAGAGDGQIRIRNAVNVTITNCLLDGNRVFVNGMIFGDSHQRVSGLVINCTSTNHQGDIVDNDAGIGFKSLNSTITYSNCVSAWNLKGWDCGEINSDEGFTNKVISCTASNNYWGMNGNGAATTDYFFGNGFYFINCLIVSNAFKGIHIYAPPYNAAVVHCLFDNNGAAGVPFNGSALSVTPETFSDTNVCGCYTYNNIFQNSVESVLENNASGPTNRFTWVIDYNSYKQAGSERFCLWSLDYAPSQVFFQFGVDGPGHASGNWYNWYANNTTAPLFGTGHFHSDAHSSGTGCDDPVYAEMDGYVLANANPGLVLSSQPWFIPEMALNRDGTQRGSWDKGMQDVNPTRILRKGPQKIRGLRLYK